MDALQVSDDAYGVDPLCVLTLVVEFRVVSNGRFKSFSEAIQFS